MTREQIIGKLKHLQVQFDDKYTDETYQALPSGRYRAIANYIINDFESQKCENCKSFIKRKDISHLCTMGNSCGVDEYGIPTVLRTWGCNEFERKEL